MITMTLIFVALASSLTIDVYWKKLVSAGVIGRRQFCGTVDAL